MQCSIYCRRFLLFGVLTSLPVQADFNQATTAYLLGDFEKARYEALVDATDGKPQAQMLLGQLYFNGEGVEKDLTVALYWYEKAASQGLVDAQYRVGTLYFDGKSNIPKDYDKAYKWLQLALENGRSDAKPMLDSLYKLETGNVVNLQESPEVPQLKQKQQQQKQQQVPQKLSPQPGRNHLQAPKTSTQIQNTKPTSALQEPSCGNIETKDTERTREDVSRVFRQYRNTIHSAYNLALLKNKNLSGRVEYEVEIDPAGRVSSIEKRPISTLDAPEFEARLVQAIKQINFCAKGTKPFKVAYPIEFIPPANDETEDTDPAGNNQRSYLDVHNVFVQHKSSVNDLYLRVYEQDKKIRGRVMFELTIQADGSASSVTIQSSELESPALEEELIDYVKTMNFGKKNSAPYEVNYPLDFLP